MEKEDEPESSLVTQRGVHFTVADDFVGMVLIETDHGFIRIDMDDLRHFFGEYVRHKKIRELLNAPTDVILKDDLRV